MPEKKREIREVDRKTPYMLRPAFLSPLGLLGNKLLWLEIRLNNS